ncbi:hypothetical protein [Zoogloea oleivorans]|uniref:hypothetical protein n=1 Tax=Zoogloea oleivorans TaxID=1552750 RepID=UPI001652B3D5|nr:hypothetical protein [Zoogloea oleivorans]
MNIEVAKYLLESLIERIDRGSIGTVSSGEREALGVALSLLKEDHRVSLTPPQEEVRDRISDTLPAVPASPSRPTPVEEPLREKPSVTVKTVELNLDAIHKYEVDEPDLLMCLDFGTAMSKAFAMSVDGQSYELELGAEAGGEGYAVPSSVFISDAGKVLFGFEAVEGSQELVDSGRQRLDSIKSWLSLRVEGDLDAYILSKELNPSEVKLTEGDLIRIYLAYLTDLGVTQLQTWFSSEKPSHRHVRRRFAHPCWPSAAQKTWADRLMRQWLAEAQILADTFHGQWKGGIDVALVKAAVDKVRSLPRRPEYLIAEGVPEPVAVAAGALVDGQEKRLPFVVIDVGAGTTDFGLFILRENEEDESSRVFQVPGSIKALLQAGDKVDGMLKKFILDAQAVDVTDSQGRLVAADLSRRIRRLKERLFETGEVKYVLADSTPGRINQEDFLASRPMREFAERVQTGFRAVLESIDDTWLNYLSQAGLSVILTGGGAKLPMMKELAQGWVEVRGKRITRTGVNPLPSWIPEQTPDLEPVYPQLAVAIGGAAAELPETVEGPQAFGGGGGRSSYAAGSLQLSGA